MTEEELKEMMALLEKAGAQPLLCDTPIPLYETPVHAGNPVEPGCIPPDMKLVPKALLAAQPEMMVRVNGNSMADAGIEDGDLVKMTLDMTPRDGDIVVVVIDEECTVKSYYEDDEGQCWLVPQNKAESALYKVIRLDDELVNVHLCGVVGEVFKPLPRVSCKSLRSAVAEAKKSYKDEPKISEQQVSYTIREIAPLVTIARLWYAVYRILADYNVVEEDDFDTFINKVVAEVPHHEHLPSKTELQRLAVQSFAKPVSKWRPDNAPVKGSRYKLYATIANKTEELLLRK